MIKKQSKIQDLLLLYPELFKDSRGEYFQTFNIDEYKLRIIMVQQLFLRRMIFQYQNKMY